MLLLGYLTMLFQLPEFYDII